MVRKLSLILAALALGLLLVNQGVNGKLYETVYVGVVVIGLLLSVFYLSTWGFYAIRAWHKGLLQFKSLTVLEFIIIPILAVPSFATALRNVIVIGFAVVPDPAVRTSRLIGLATLLLVMILRTLNWVLRWRNKDRENVAPGDPVSESSSV